MRHTPWVQKASGGGLTSDRLRPAPAPARVGTPKGKGKAGGTTEQLRSAAVRALEDLTAGLRSEIAGREKDPAGGCFCQARVHVLNAYAPLCRTCGLILCSVNPPYRTCPSCDSAPVPPASVPTLLSRLDGELADTLAREDAARVQAVDDARRAAGAFPTLQGSAPPTRTPSPGAAAQIHAPAPTTHKVLSLHGGKRVTLSSYTTSPAGSRPVSRGDGKSDEQRAAEEMGSRIAAPPREVVCAPPLAPGEISWEDRRPGARKVRYIPTPSGGEGKKGKAKAKEGAAEGGAIGGGGAQKSTKAKGKQKA